MFSALRYRNYRLFWFGQLISVTGTFLQGTAQQWLITTLTPNPVALGIVGALQFGPILLLGPFGGVIADRWPRRAILCWTQGISGLLALVLWALTITNLVQIWHIFILALLLGVINAVDMPTRQAFVSEMVPTESLLNAVSLNSAQFNASRIVGPALAGVIIAVLGIPILFLLNGISYIAVIVGLLMMRPSELIAMPHVAAKGKEAFRAMGEGMRFVWDSPTLRTTMFLVTIIGTFGFNFNVLQVLEAQVVLRSGSVVYGFLTSSLGVGALTGALLLARRRGAPTNRLLIGTAGAFGVLEAGIALTRSVPLAMLLFAGTGFCMSSFSAAANTRMQLSSPPELRGRVMSVYMQIFNGTTPFGNLLVSSVAGAGGVPMAFMVAGLPSLAAAGIAGWIWRGRPVRGGQRARGAAPVAEPVIARADQVAPGANVPPMAGRAVASAVTTEASPAGVPAASNTESTAPLRLAGSASDRSGSGWRHPAPLRLPGQPAITPNAPEPR